MSIQEFTRGGLNYGQMMEDQDGLFHQGGSMIFCCQEGYSSTADDFTTLQEAADAWACWMRYQGHEVIELPRTARTREWSLVYSVTVHREGPQDARSPGPSNHVQNVIGDGQVGVHLVR